MFINSFVLFNIYLNGMYTYSFGDFFTHEFKIKTLDYLFILHFSKMVMENVLFVQNPQNITKY